jgi:hypothetical protein
MTTTRTTLALRAGDALLAHGGRVVASVERNLDNLGAALIRFTDGSFSHVGAWDAHMVSRVGA